MATTTTTTTSTSNNKDSTNPIPKASTLEEEGKTSSDDNTNNNSSNSNNTGMSDERFVNQGLALWEKTREEWLAHNRNSDTDSTTRAAVPVDVDDIIDVVFAPRWRGAVDEPGPPKRFPQNVPLTQMVDILQDLWEAEGLDM